ncbi:hypothetical protein N7474_004332 [Penicillium riverlandense]|uniref:uncharacterized protein n=1 Tax=Penicillium riverlandense TaxID=1903569 RepID=UPI002548194F|nr:uncharacterized protein N7474_004332 [Penicillium riverlandense]KAJ5818741.1 hypothetical protein N7474_004332 [Penicillium riverlandense]
MEEKPPNSAEPWSSDEQYASVTQNPTKDDSSSTLSATNPALDSTNSDAKTEPTKDGEREHIAGFKLFMVIAAVTLVCFLVMLDTSIIVTAIPKITTQFHSLQDIGWYGSAYQIASASLQPLTGRIYTNFSTKWTYLSFFLIFELGSLLCAISTSSKMLIVARAVAGLGSSGLLNGSMTIIASSVPMYKSPALIGIMMGFAQMGIVLGPVLGGAFTEYSTWRWCFYLNLPVGAVAALLLLVVQIPDQVEKPSVSLIKETVLHKLDLIGFVLFAPAAVQLLLALQYGGNKFAWNSSTVIGLFCGSGATFIVFLLWEHRQKERAMIPLAMLRLRPVWSSCLTIACVMALVLCNSYYLPVYFQAVKNVSPILSGVYMLPGILTQLVFAVMSGLLIGKLGYYLPWAVFCGVATAIGNGLLSTFKPDTSTAKWVGYQILLGAGRGSGFQTPMVAVQNTLPPAQVSVAMSVLIFSQTLSGAVFLTFADVIFDNGLRTLVPQYAPSVDPEALIAAGASGIRNVVAGDNLAGVLKAYCASIDHVFYMAAALGVGIFASSWGMGWKDVRKKKPTGDKV